MSDDAPKFVLMHARADGTYVIAYNGLPYHVVKDDPLYEVVKEAADAHGPLPPEPPPPAIVPFNIGD